MADAVRSLPDEIIDNVELKIRDVFTMEGLNRKKELNVLVIPSITINNRLAFETLIPDEEELIDVMHEFLQEVDEEIN